MSGFAAKRNRLFAGAGGDEARIPVTPTLTLLCRMPRCLCPPFL